MTTPLRERLSDQIAYLTDNPPDQIRTNSVVWRDTVTLLREALAALSSGAVAPREEWQPIATAPKDGRMLLLYPSSCWTEDTEFDYEVSYWEEDSACFQQSAYPDDFEGFTHWMPLPASPGASRAAETPACPTHSHCAGVLLEDGRWSCATAAETPEAAGSQGWQLLPRYVAVVPCAHGGVQIEGHTAKEDWELELDTSGNVIDYFHALAPAAPPAETPEVQEPPEHVHSRACDCVGTIRYRKDGEEKTWGVGSACTSTVQGLEAHLRRWIPDAEFMDATIEPARPASPAPARAAEHEDGGERCLVGHYEGDYRHPHHLPACVKCQHCHAWVRPEHIHDPCPARAAGEAQPSEKGSAVD